MAKPLSSEKAMEFAELLDFLEHFDKVGWIPPRPFRHDLRADAQSTAEQFGGAAALRGLRQALGDILEVTADRSDEWVRKFDGQCRNAGLKTLSEYRVAQSSKFRRVLTRGKISSLEQFYMLAAYEAKAV